MTSLVTKPLGDDISFGVRISGVTLDSLGDEAVRTRLLDLFEERGMIVFEKMDPSTDLHIALSNVFGPLEDHPLKAANKHVDGDSLPGVIDMESTPGEATVIEIGGEALAGWTPWHFDSAYAKKLCRGAVLRPITIPPEGGRTGFADGVQLYQAISPELRARLEGKEVIYHPNRMLTNLRLGMPADWRYLNLAASSKAKLDMTVDAVSAIHPAIWTRASGEKVLHLSVQNATGIVGMDAAAGEALLEEALQEIQRVMKPYWHRWSPTDMLIWDNWRMIHQAGGTPAHLPRRMHRTTIAGDYGFGRLENEPAGERAFALTA